MTETKGFVLEIMLNEEETDSLEKFMKEWDKEMKGDRGSSGNAEFQRHLRNFAKDVLDHGGTVDIC